MIKTQKIKTNFPEVYKRIKTRKQELTEDDLIAILRKNGIVISFSIKKGTKSVVSFEIKAYDSDHHVDEPHLIRGQLDEKKGNDKAFIYMRAFELLNRKYKVKISSLKY